MVWWPWRRPLVESASGVRHSDPDGGWAGLPPVQRTLGGTLSPTAPLEAFRADLVTSRDPSFLRPLGHRVDPADGGWVEGIAGAVRPRVHAGLPELPVPTRTAPGRRPRVQRAEATWSTAAEPASPTGGALADVALPDAPPVDPAPAPEEQPTATAGTGPPAPGAGSSVEPLPARTLPAVPDAVARTGSAPEPALPLLPVAAGPALQRTVSTPTDQLSGFAAAITAAGSVPTPGSGDLAPPAPVSPAPASPTAASLAPAPLAPAPLAPAPLAPGAPARELAEPGSTRTVPQPAPELPVVLRSAQPSAPEPGRRATALPTPQVATLGRRTGPADLAPVAARPLALLSGFSAEPPVQRVQHLRPVEHQPSIEDQPFADYHRPATAPPPRPVRGLPSLLRSLSAPGAPAPAPASTVQRLGPSERLHLQRAPQALPASRTLTASQTLNGPQAHTEPLAHALPGPEPEGPADAPDPSDPPNPFDPPGPAVAVQRWHPPSAASPTAGPIRGEVGPAQLRTPPRAERSFASMFAGTGGAAPAPEVLRLQRQPEPAAATPPPPAMTSESAPVEPPPVEPPPDPGPATPISVAAAPAAGAPVSAGTSAAELEEMARRLYEPLSARLRAELWLDRERAGR